MELGAYIRQRRQLAGFSLRKFAAMLHVNPAYLSRVERGIVPPSDTLVQAIAATLGTDAEAFFLLAGRVPQEWQQTIATAPRRVVETLRTALASCVAETSIPYSHTVLAFGGTRAIEDTHFPFEALSDIAELESWRKEINRPVYHIHKWWAQRLGSVFRAIVLASFAPKGSNILEMFYQPARLTGAVILDPFMGSGTTIGEALKLGARAIGRDINPVAHFMVRNALTVHPRHKVVETFQAIERDLASTIRHFYRTQLPQGGVVDVLYYFWVKIIPCPGCEIPVDLFSSYVFARHAYPTRNPEAHAVCPHCGAINTLRYDTEQAMCSSCYKTFSPQIGPANGTKATCPSCGEIFSIAKTIQEQGKPPAHRLYAKLVLHPHGLKEYLPADADDLALYNEASQALKERQEAYPLVALEPGYNTNQVLHYAYTHWHQMFNDRQLLCLSLLAERIRAIPNEELRTLFTCLFSGTLEFNNMFASFKGEGTGAVRHMFAHHILKPERTPLEANLWGTPKSSGAFSTLFESRLLRALDYCEKPFELRISQQHGKIRSAKVYGLSCRLGHDVAGTFVEFCQGRQLYLSCGDAAHTDLAPESVDAVITDPPFFDNVHYSQLADFFYVWQCYVLGKNGHHKVHSTRSQAEVQQSDPHVFTERLCGVWTECYRVLRSDGLLVFTYHHSRTEGWRCVLEALVRAGFGIVATHPIKAEMSVATPKKQAKEPIDLDVIIVCRKRTSIPSSTPQTTVLIAEASQEALEQISRFNKAGRTLSRNDVRVILMSHIIKKLSQRMSSDEGVRYLEADHIAVENTITSLYHDQHITDRVLTTQEYQLTLW